MATSQRLSRGFHRLGLVLAALALSYFLYIGLVETPPGKLLDPFWVIGGVIFGAIIYGLVRVIGWVIGGFAAS
jgi:hypothetical protein